MAISQQNKLQDGTKELILNAIYQRPRTIAQVAQQLGLSPPTVHRHIAELLASELIREVAAPEEGRPAGVARYYQPSLPVVLAVDREALRPALDAFADGIAASCRAEGAALARAFEDTSLPARQESFEALLHYLYATATRMARERLEASGDLPPWPEHADGSRWVWWAEEPLGTEVG